MFGVDTTYRFLDIQTKLKCWLTESIQKARFVYALSEMDLVEISPQNMTVSVNNGILYQKIEQYVKLPS